MDILRFRLLWALNDAGPFIIVEIARWWFHFTPFPVVSDFKFFLCFAEVYSGVSKCTLSEAFLGNAILSL